MRKVVVKSVIDSELAVSAENGNKLHSRIARHLSSGKSVELSFQGIDLVTSAFLNNAVGKLCKKFDSEKIKESIMVTGLDEGDKKLLDKVINNAELYYRDPEKMKKLYDEVFKED